jgi:hypothetical protein
VVGSDYLILLDCKMISCNALRFYYRVIRTERVGEEYTKDFRFPLNIEAFIDESYEYPSGLTKLQALILAFYAGCSTGRSRLHIKSKSWYMVVKTFFFHLSDLCVDVAPHLNYRESDNMVLDSIGLEEGDIGDSLVALCFRGSDQTATLSAAAREVSNDLFKHSEETEVGSTYSHLQNYNFQIEAYLTGLREGLAKGRIFYIEKGYVGQAVQSIAEGDIITIIQGCKIPLILRKRGLHFVIVGPCYMPGIMDGEAVVEMKGAIVDLEIH